MHRATASGKSQSVDEVCRFAATSLQSQLTAMRQELLGVRLGEDIECLHRMRVASRRARTILRLFDNCFPRKWTQPIRRVTKALGTARDLDVQTAFIQRFLGKLSDDQLRIGVAHLLGRVQQSRVIRQTDVHGALNHLKRSGILEKMVGVQGDTHMSRTTSPVLLKRARKAIAGRMAAVAGQDPRVMIPEQLHALRIAIKRLRYTMEIFAPIFDNALQVQVHTTRSLQELLGEIHDCDVWIAYLPNLMGEVGLKRPGTACLIPGIELLLVDRQAYRNDRYTTLLGCWETHAHYLSSF